MARAIQSPDFRRLLAAANWSTSSSRDCAPTSTCLTSHPGQGRRLDHGSGLRDPLTLRLGAINLFDPRYRLRAATGVGEFAPQYGPRRGLFVEVNQRF